MNPYVHPEVLVTTEWASNNINNPKVRIVEVDVDTKAYDEGHLPNALGWAWNTQLCDTVQRDIIPKAQFEALMGSFLDVKSSVDPSQVPSTVTYWSL